MGRYKKHLRMKTFEVFAYRKRNGKEVLSAVLEKDSRTQEEAISQGENYSKMMGYRYSHVREKVDNRQSVAF
jgi:hypothetical protein